MADQSKSKPGFLARLFGRGKTAPDALPENGQDAALDNALAQAPPMDEAPDAGVESSSQMARLDAPETAQEAVPVATANVEAGQILPPTERALAVPDILAGQVSNAVLPIAPPVPEAISGSPAVSGPVAMPAQSPARQSWWSRLTSGLSRTSSNLTTGIAELFTKRKLDAATLEDLEDILIQADLGLATSARIAAAVGQGRYDKTIAPDEVRNILAREVSAILAPVALPLVINTDMKPFVILMVGVNGSGKTTTIGKLTAKFRAEGHSVLLAAGDTFRAAAIEQLKVWGERTGASIVAREQGADAAGLAFDALTQARLQKTDILMIDTAGRLQNKTGLMDELAKVVRVIRKVDASAPHAVLLVLDATVGQNAISQVEAFRETAGVTGLVMTKLDGTARGGILVALAAKFGLPVHFIGVGEGVDDLEPFASDDFARAIAGLEETGAGEKRPKGME